MLRKHQRCTPPSNRSITAKQAPLTDPYILSLVMALEKLSSSIQEDWMSTEAAIGYIGDQLLAEKAKRQENIT
eukprot:15366734-Ditylum_brightwellii.AAC.1